MKNLRDRGPPVRKHCCRPISIQYGPSVYAKSLLRVCVEIKRIVFGSSGRQRLMDNLKSITVRKHKNILSIFLSHGL